MTKTFVLIVAAGRGTRLGGERPKQYLNLSGVPLLRRSVLCFLDHPLISGLRVVIHPNDRELYEKAVGDLDLLSPVAGGQTRQESVLNGLESLHDNAPDFVLIHDAARPFVRAETIDALVATLENGMPGAIPALPVVDSLKIADNMTISAEQPRDHLWRAQTPQAFHFSKIIEAHRRFAGAGESDDAAVARAAGLDVQLIQGRDENLKVTNEKDLESAERWLRSAPEKWETRVGNGFDVHRVGPGDKMTLCGIEIPGDISLIGHSDADVALHALTDALLGALGAGDIGLHFPPSDARWKGASSDRFLAHAAGLIEAAGGRILNLDLTLICEAPKIGPHREAMRNSVADILNLDQSRISIKATTTEKLGFTGRGEGIAAQANAAISLPVERSIERPS